MLDIIVLCLLGRRVLIQNLSVVISSYSVEYDITLLFNFQKWRPTWILPIMHS